jgi:heme/copper-type cytochrome/quinol oxidase subunit 3
VKDSSRNLGIVFFIFGAVAFAAVLIAKFFALQQIATANIPEALNNVPGILLNDVISPLRLVSLICLIGGILLIATSLIYPRLKSSKLE